MKLTKVKGIKIQAIQQFKKEFKNESKTSIKLAQAKIMKMISRGVYIQRLNIVKFGRATIQLDSNMIVYDIYNDYYLSSLYSKKMMKNHKQCTKSMFVLIDKENPLPIIYKKDCKYKVNDKLVTYYNHHLEADSRINNTPLIQATKEELTARFNAMLECSNIDNMDSNKAKVYILDHKLNVNTYDKIINFCDVYSNSVSSRKEFIKEPIISEYDKMLVRDKYIEYGLDENGYHFVI